MKKRYSSLDLLKFLSVIAIGNLLHYRGIGAKFGYSFPLEQVPILGTLARYGHFLVELLVLISGLLACQSYFSRIRENKYSFSKFLKGRITRLYPAMIASVLVMAVLQWSHFAYTSARGDGAFFADLQNHTLPDLALSLFGIQNWVSRDLTVNHPTWYLSILMLCYLIFYGIAALCRKKDMRLLFLLPVLAGIIILKTGLNFAMFHSYTARGLCAFFLGVLLQMLLENAHIKDRTFCLAALGMLLFCIGFRLTLPFSLLGDLSLFLSFFVYPALVTLCVKSKLLNRICDCSLFHYLGNISFGIYLWDSPVYVGFGLFFLCSGKAFDFSSPAVYATIFAVHVLMGILSYHLIERPMLRKLSKPKKEE